MNQLKILASICLLGALSLPALAGPQHKAVLAELSGMEDAPTAARLTALGPGVKAELMDISADASQKRSVRARALHALGWFPDADTRAVLQSALTGDDPLMARKAVYGLANGWGSAALAPLTEALASPDVQLRSAAARALGSVDSPDARAALDARLQLEQTPAVRESIERALQPTR